MLPDSSRNGWVVEPPDSPWTNFLTKCCKQDSLFTVGDIIEVGCRLGDETVHVHGTNFRIVVRPEMMNFYNLLVVIASKREPDREQGVIIGGSSGIVLRFGPCAGDIVASMGSDKAARMEQHSKDVIRNIDPKVLKKLVEDALSQEKVSVDCGLPSIFLSWRDPSDTGYNKCIVVFKNIKIFSWVMTELGDNEKRISVELFSKARWIPGAAALAGACFEKIVIRRLSEATKNSRLAIEMVEKPSGIGYIASEDRRPTIVTLLSGKRALAWEPKMKNLTIGSLYVPESRVNPMIDCFMISEEGKGTKKQTYVFWMIQITLSEKHGAAERGYALVEAICNSFMDGRQGSKRINYVLIVPDDMPGFPRKVHEWALKFKSRSRSAPKVYIHYADVLAGCIV
ncbi:hypothetical protein ONZ45_g16556 [Pleurotus djamor]|nr:hypothetical protein ONZ45_g16556 [Pleurotus djamor]